MIESRNTILRVAFINHFDICEITCLMDRERYEEVKKAFEAGDKKYKTLAICDETFDKDDRYVDGKWLHNPEKIRQLQAQNKERKLMIDLIRNKYDIDDEIAMIIKGIEDRNNPEFNGYLAYRYECKEEARKMIENGGVK